MNHPHQERQKSPPRRTSILVRATRQLLLLTVFTTVLLSLIAYFVSMALLEQRVLQQLASLVSAKEDVIEERLQHDREATALLSGHRDMQDTLRGGKEGEARMARFLTELQSENASVEGITVFTARGEVAVQVGVSVQNNPQGIAATTLRTLLGKGGWEGYEIFSPIRSATGKKEGVLAVRYGIQPLVDTLFSVSSLGQTAEVLLARQNGETLEFLNYHYKDRPQTVLGLGKVDEEYGVGSPAAQAVKGEEGIRRAEDYAGRDVFVAYRNIKSLGWGLIVQVERQEVLQGVRALAAAFVLIGLILLALSVLLAYLLARNLTKPLLILSQHVEKLGPSNWTFRRSVHTRDEVERLDWSIADMARRLEGGYRYLEREVASRTKELKEQYAKDHTILESIRYGILVLDERGSVVDMNPAALHLLGLAKREDALGAAVGQVLSLRRHQKPVPAERHPVLRCLQLKKSICSTPDEQFSILRRDGSLLPVLLMAAPLSSGRHFLGAIVVFQDMTEERQLDYMKSEFISLASHQLRTPLSTITWYLELLSTDKEYKLTHTQKTYVAEMANASVRMTHLIDALLHVSKLEGGGIAPQKRSVNIVSVLRETSENMRSSAKDKKISFRILLPEHAVEISTDPTLLQMVLHNILSNAIKYSDAGGEVQISLVPSKAHVDILVKDTGVGIPSDEKPRIFTKLFRGYHAIKMDTTGNGLGLYISKLIVNQLGGAISFRSIEGRGSIFRVRIPVSGKRKERR